MASHCGACLGKPFRVQNLLVKTGSPPSPKKPQEDFCLRTVSVRRGPREAPLQTRAASQLLWSFALYLLQLFQPWELIILKDISISELEGPLWRLLSKQKYIFTRFSWPGADRPMLLDLGIGSQGPQRCG